MGCSLVRSSEDELLIEEDLKAYAYSLHFSPGSQPAQVNGYDGGFHLGNSC